MEASLPGRPGRGTVLARLCHSHFIDEAVKAQRDGVICSGSHRLEEAKLPSLGSPCGVAETDCILQTFPTDFRTHALAYFSAAPAACLLLRGAWGMGVCVPAFCGGLATLPAGPSHPRAVLECQRPDRLRGLHVGPSVQEATLASHRDILFSEDSVWDVPPL